MNSSNVVKPLPPQVNPLEYAKRPGNSASNVPTINEVVGGALQRINNYVNLDNKKQKVAIVDDVRFTLLTTLLIFS